jgi:hypothetical protein
MLLRLPTAAPLPVRLTKGSVVILARARSSRGRAARRPSLLVSNTLAAKCLIFSSRFRAATPVPLGNELYSLLESSCSAAVPRSTRSEHFAASSLNRLI